MGKTTNILLRYPRAVLAVVIIVVITAAFIAISRCTRNDYVSVVTNDRIDRTPEVVESLRAIGQWEFLSVSDEEMVDTVRKSFWGDDHLVRIYYGTLRLGIDMSKVGKDWIKACGDTVQVTLPKITLLDEDFIDETKTRSFHENGKWTDSDRKLMFQKAQRMMKSRCMTQSNIKSAEENALRQFHMMMRNLGFKEISIKFK